MLRDNIGNIRSYARFIPEPLPYIVDASTEGVTYICFDAGAKRAIRRITESDGVTTIEWAWGAWANRASLSYVPINTPIDDGE